MYTPSRTIACYDRSMEKYVSGTDATMSAFGERFSSSRHANFRFVTPPSVTLKASELPKVTVEESR